MWETLSFYKLVIFFLVLAITSLMKLKDMYTHTHTHNVSLVITNARETFFGQRIIEN